MLRTHPPNGLSLSDFGRPHYAFLDALRGIATLGVLAVHSSVPGLPPILSQALGAGARGVQLFYLVSAFTIFLSLEQRGSPDSFSARDFFIRRFFRIAPLFWVAIVFYNRFLPDAHFWPELLATFTFTHGFNPYWINSVVPGGWSIAVEMTFYLLIPLLFRFVTNLTRASLLLAASCVLCVALQGFMKSHCPISLPGFWEMYRFLFFPAQLPVFAIGIVLYFLVRPALHGAEHRPPSPRQLLAVGGMFLLLCLVGAVPFYVLASAGFAVGAGWLAYRPSRLFVNRFTLLLGRISYSLYLTHHAAVMVRNALFKQWLPALSPLGMELLSVAIVLPTAVLISLATYRWIEQPGQRLGKWLAASGRSRLASPA